MKASKKICKMISSVLIMTMMMSLNVSAKESSFLDYTYKGTGYTTTESGSYDLVAKIDTYYYINLQEYEFCAADVYFSKRNSSGNVVSTYNYGYGVAQFEKNGTAYASSGRVYGYTNVEAWSEGYYSWNYGTPHYYGTCIY